MGKSITKFILLMLVILTLFTGCSIVDKGKLKLGLKNEDFEYIKNDEVDKIVIQSTRDKGFRFVVADDKTIKDVYNLLSSAKAMGEKVDLESDYIFEIYVGEEVKKFNYVVGVDEKSKGNFYDENKVYYVSSRIDNDIIQNLSFVRKPRDFSAIYYGSILKVLEEKKSYLNDGNKRVGIDILGDVECTKYILSRDLEAFNSDMAKITNNVKIINGNKQDFDVIITVRNQGYTSKKFKTNITIENKNDHSYEIYYVWGDYDLKAWSIQTSTTKPKDW
ncbi:hypothetical protein [Clostridium intestinale]|uniref:YhfM-like domain-containing protein n=1 Tax=Clostridium intestinale TaxID=36845 RepID=A0A7D6VQN7_9CLOT|nr:hypothetical protein [Clostridium intestinale]QLY79648.1 hypothetical protein HZF06_21950 [Clostridium intestinale]